MFVELDERELMKHDGGGMLLSAWDLCHAIEKFIGKNFRWIRKGNRWWIQQNFSNHEQHYAYAGWWRFRNRIINKSSKISYWQNQKLDL